MNRERKHTLTEKSPVGAAAGLFLAAELLQMIVLLGVRQTGLLNALPSDTSEGTSIILASVLLLIVMRAWYSPQYQGMMESDLPGKETLLATLPMAAYSLLAIAAASVKHGFYFRPTFRFFVMGLTAGVGEETLFRVTVIPVCMGFLKGEKRVWSIPAVTGGMFGLAHMGNLTSGASLTNGIVQAIVTAMMGFYLGVLFVITGSAFPGIMLHSVHDFLCFAADPGLANGVMTGSLEPWEITYTIVLGLMLAASGVVLLRRIGSDRILEVWRAKWSQDAH